MLKMRCSHNRKGREPWVSCILQDQKAGFRVCCQILCKHTLAQSVTKNQAVLVS